MRPLRGLQETRVATRDILCQPLLLPSIFPSIRVFSSESVFHAHMYTRTQTRVCIHTWTYASVYVCIYSHVSAWMSTCARVCLSIGREELPHVRGQGQKPGGLHAGGAAAERSYAATEDRGGGRDCQAATAQEQGRRLGETLRVPWTARRSNQSTLEGMMLKLKLQYFGHLMRSVDSLEKNKKEERH